MNNPLRFLITSLGLATLGFSTAQAAVSLLTFEAGNGSASFDQYTGTAGGGWLGPWTVANGSNTTNISTKTSVLGATPLFSGGGNYLHVGYDAGAGGSSARASRQWDINSISMTDSFVIDFYFRSDTTIANAAQVFNLIGSSGATTTTSANDSWFINISGAGVAATSYTAPTGSVTLLNGTQAQVGTAGVAFHFTITVNPVADTYVVGVTNPNNNASFTSSALGLRNGNNASLSYINFGVARGGSALAATDLGYSIDNLSITSLAAIPEPGSFALLAGVACLGLAHLRTSRRRRG